MNCPYINQPRALNGCLKRRMGQHRAGADVQKQGNEKQKNPQVCKQWVMDSSTPPPFFFFFYLAGRWKYKRVLGCHKKKKKKKRKVTSFSSVMELISNNWYSYCLFFCSSTIRGVMLVLQAADFINISLFRFAFMVFPLWLLFDVEMSAVCSHIRPDNTNK